MQNKKEELQSRREFFKKAAKAALPVVGAVVASQLPFVSANASESMTCNNWCTSCTGTCAGVCKGACARSCSGSCSGACKGFY